MGSRCCSSGEGPHRGRPRDPRVGAGKPVPLAHVLLADLLLQNRLEAELLLDLVHLAAQQPGVGVGEQQDAAPHRHGAEQLQLGAGRDHVRQTADGLVLHRLDGRLAVGQGEHHHPLGARLPGRLVLAALRGLVAAPARLARLAVVRGHARVLPVHVVQLLQLAVRGAAHVVAVLHLEPVLAGQHALARTRHGEVRGEQEAVHEARSGDVR